MKLKQPGKVEESVKQHRIRQFPANLEKMEKANQKRIQKLNYRV